MHSTKFSILRQILVNYQEFNLAGKCKNLTEWLLKLHFSILIWILLLGDDTVMCRLYCQHFGAPFCRQHETEQLPAICGPIYMYQHDLLGNHVTLKMETGSQEYWQYCIHVHGVIIQKQDPHWHWNAWQPKIFSLILLWNTKSRLKWNQTLGTHNNTCMCAYIHISIHTLIVILSGVTNWKAWMNLHFHYSLNNSTRRTKL